MGTTEAPRIIQTEDKNWYSGEFLRPNKEKC